jgi:hypothetical protein
MLTFFANLYCPKALHRLHHWKRIVECHRKILFLNSTFSPGLELRTVFRSVALVPEISSKRTSFALAPFFYHA